LLINEIISECLNKEVNITRDNEKNIIIKIDETTLLGTDRKELMLSTGEQNFLSLAFELLKAKRVKAPIIVMDDPMSSFDSIYKNKIAFCIVKFLKSKSQIILTHNIDLVRLLDVQMDNCFSLYLLKNDDEDICGFMEVRDKEKPLIPFMRAVVKIIKPDNHEEHINKLTTLMHGYNTEKVNITEVYNFVFCKKVEEQFIISAQDIAEVINNNVEFMNKNEYPILVNTLKHVLNVSLFKAQCRKSIMRKNPKQTERL